MTIGPLNKMSSMTLSQLEVSVVRLVQDVPLIAPFARNVPQLPCTRKIEQLAIAVAPENRLHRHDGQRRELPPHSYDNMPPAPRLVVANRRQSPAHHLARPNDPGVDAVGQLPINVEIEQTHRRFSAIRFTVRSCRP